VEALSGCDVSVEHVGSTAVPGLASKPILDVDVVFGGATTFAEVRARLEGVGYVHRGDRGVAGREAFRADGNDGPGVTGASRWPEHHLYVGPAGGRELRRHLEFRDALRASPSLAARYAALKRALARDSGADREAYTRGKSDFVERVISEARLPIE
jgi:GrpB-like predicted nucleotidyltransferase (UPF0157 family)